jgi:hypothetical protein
MIAFSDMTLMDDSTKGASSIFYNYQFEIAK